MRTRALGPTIAQIAMSLVESLYLVGLVLTCLHLQLRTRAHGLTTAHIRWRAQPLGKAAQKEYLPRAWVFATMQQHYLLLLMSHCQEQHRALPYAIFCVQVPSNMCMLMHTCMRTRVSHSEQCTITQMRLACTQCLVNYNTLRFKP